MHCCVFCYDGLFSLWFICISMWLCFDLFIFAHFFSIFLGSLCWRSHLWRYFAQQKSFGYSDLFIFLLGFFMPSHVVVFLHFCFLWLLIKFIFLDWTTINNKMLQSFSSSSLEWAIKLFAYYVRLIVSGSLDLCVAFFQFNISTTTHICEDEKCTYCLFWHLLGCLSTMKAFPRFVAFIELKQLFMCFPSSGLFYKCTMRLYTHSSNLQLILFWVLFILKVGELCLLFQS